MKRTIGTATVAIVGRLPNVVVGAGAVMAPVFPWDACGRKAGACSVKEADMLDIRVAGSGCRACQELEARVKQALTEMDAEATVMKVTDFQEMARAGILATPGLIVNGKVMLQGKLPSVGIVKGLLEEALRS